MENENYGQDNQEVKKENYSKLIIGLLIAAVFIIAFNSYQISSLGSLKGNLATTPSVTGAAVRAQNQPEYDIIEEIIPAGTPSIYGEELGISFDDVSPNDPARANAAINLLAQLDQNINLNAKDNERYINVLYKLENGISCEYCCGARAIIFADGKPACGCAHSFAMRGITKYLITEHGSEYTDEQLLEEAGKWKVLFFPGPMQLKASVLQGKGIELNYINLASNKYRGIEQGAGTASGMVGGC